MKRMTKSAAMLVRVSGSRMSLKKRSGPAPSMRAASTSSSGTVRKNRSEEHTSELQSLMRISYAVFCLKKKKEESTSTIKQVRNCTRMCKELEITNRYSD